MVGLCPSNYFGVVAGGIRLAAVSKVWLKRQGLQNRLILNGAHFEARRSHIYQTEWCITRMVSPSLTPTTLPDHGKQTLGKTREKTRTEPIRRLTGPPTEACRSLSALVLPEAP